MEIPTGICQCGCGKPTLLYTSSDKTRGWTKGEPRKFLKGHNKGLVRNGTIEPIQCASCKEWFGLDDFYKRTDTTYDSHCKACHREKTNKLRKRNYLKASYGLTIADYQRLLEDQDYRCKICLIEFGETRKTAPCVDHCHQTGKVRGLLCTQCNVALGMMKDDPDVLRRAIEYLKGDN